MNNKCEAFPAHFTYGSPHRPQSYVPLERCWSCMGLIHCFSKDYKHTAFCYIYFILQATYLLQPPFSSKKKKSIGLTPFTQFSFFPVFKCFSILINHLFIYCIAISFSSVTQVSFTTLHLVDMSVYL